MSLILHLVRHGQTLYTGEANELGETDSTIVAGTTDVVLSKTGEKAARALGETLDHKDVETFFSSDLKRARQTALLLGATATIEDPRLRELDFGAWEGLSWAEVHKLYPDELSTWAEDWVDRAPPGGESFAALADRCEQWLHDSTQERYQQQLVICAHAGTIRALLCSALDIPLAHAMKFSIDYVHVTTLALDGQQTKCLRTNSPHF